VLSWLNVEPSAEVGQYHMGVVETIFVSVG
jgi:hypothetical protein